MKCAKEFVMIKNVAIAEHEAAERQKDIEAFENYKKRCIKTIEFCDTEIEKALIEQAKKREPLIIKLSGHICNDRLGNEIFETVNTHHCIDVKTLEVYLAEHCINCEKKGEPYSYSKGGRTYLDHRDAFIIFVPKELSCN